MSVQVLHGDCREVLKTLANESIDSVVSDPPYALVSIVKRFGKNGSAPVIVPEGGSGAYARASKGFMGKQWDTGETAFDHTFWADVLRVLKPGGHIVAFSGTRTYHRMACAIEDAGFEIRDQIGWIYGSGFPKSHNAGNGWGTALKPAWEPICLARKSLIGTVAENVLQHGTGAINVDGCRVDASDGDSTARKPSMVNETSAPFGKGIAMGGNGSELGRWPANIVHDGSEEVLNGFPQSESSRSEVTSKPGAIYGNGSGLPAHTGIYGFDDSGSAARFFYTAKADAEDRFGSKHPTVKPVDLMQWLVRLVTPKGGTVLDPFAGTGTTGEAAYREGMNCILIEREEEYLKDIQARMAYAASGPLEREHAVMKRSGRMESVESLPLFGGPEQEKKRGGGRQIYGHFADQDCRVTTASTDQNGASETIK